MFTRRGVLKFGQTIKQNGNEITAVLVRNRKFQFNKSVREFKTDQYTGHSSQRILLIEDVKEKDIFTIEDKEYRVLNWETIGVKNKNYYNRADLFEDDFVNEVNFYRQKISLKDINLPELSSLSYLTTRARIETIKPIGYLNIGMYSDENITHVISLIYNEEIINKNDQIIWNNKSFEIVNWINENEQNRILKINCIYNEGVFNA